MINKTLIAYDNSNQLDIGSEKIYLTTFHRKYVGEFILSLDYEILTYVYNIYTRNHTETPLKTLIDEIVSLAGTMHTNYLVTNDMTGQIVYLDLEFMPEPEISIGIAYTDRFPYGSDLKYIEHQPYNISLRANVTGIKLPVQENKK